MISGTHAPGTAEGVLFGDSLGQFAMNARGQLALSARLAGPGVVSYANDAGIWLIDTDSVQTLVARMGDMMQVRPGDLRTILAAGFLVGSVNGYPIGLNDKGQLAFTAKFTDGSEGIFVATVQTLSTDRSALRD